MNAKRRVFAVIADEAKALGGDSKVAIARLWQSYFTLDKKDQTDPDTGEAFFETKEQFKACLRDMEDEDLIAVEGENVITL